jgi:hypothetical protein
MPHNGVHGAVAGANEPRRQRKIVEVPKPAPGRPKTGVSTFPKVPKVPAPKGKKPSWANYDF